MIFVFSNIYIYIDNTCINKNIGLFESYLYVPVRITINEEQFKRRWIGEIYE